MTNVRGGAAQQFGNTDWLGISWEEYEEYEVPKDLVSSSQSIALFVYDKAALAELQVAMLGVAERCGTAAVNNVVNI